MSNDKAMHVSEKSEIIDGLPPRMKRAVQDGNAFGRLVVLCAEPGMGKSDAIVQTLRYWSEHGALVKCFSLLGKDSAECAKALGLLSTMVLERIDNADRCVVAIRDVPAPDECDVEQHADEIRKMLSAGAFVLLSLRPEAEQLIEELPLATVIRAGDLVRTVHRLSGDQMRLLTNGVPTLVEACESMDMSHD